jgi:putative membrane protein
MVEMSGIAFVGAFFILVVLGAIALVVFLVTRKQSAVPVTFPASRETPLQILDRRFAAGEIDAEEYKRARDILSGGGPKS